MSWFRKVHQLHVREENGPDIKILDLQLSDRLVSGHLEERLHKVEDTLLEILWWNVLWRCQDYLSQENLGIVSEE